MALLGGALADRLDRRRLLLLEQIGLVACAGALPRCAFAGDPPLAAALRARRRCWPASARSRTSTRSAIVPNLVAPERLRPALALNFGLYQLTLVVGPGARRPAHRRGWGSAAAYAVDAAELPRDGRRRCWRMAPQPPHGEHEAAAAGVGRSIAEGLRFVRGNQALMGSFAIDLLAMTFGMPRALFPVLAVERLRRGRGGHRACSTPRSRPARRSPR